MQKAVQLEYNIPKGADGAPQLVLNMKLMTQAAAECASHCHSIEASKMSKTFLMLVLLCLIYFGLFAGVYADSMCKDKAQTLLKLLPVWRNHLNTLLKSVDCDMKRCAQIGAARLFLTFLDQCICQQICRQAATRMQDATSSLLWPKLLCAICAKFGKPDEQETSSIAEIAAQEWGASSQSPAKCIPPVDKETLAEKETLAQQMADELIAEEKLAKFKQARKLHKAQAAKKQSQELFYQHVVSESDTGSDADSDTDQDLGSCEASVASSTELSDEPDWMSFIQLLTCPLSKVGNFFLKLDDLCDHESVERAGDFQRPGHPCRRSYL